MGINFNNNSFGNLTTNKAKNNNQANFTNLDSKIEDAVTKKVKVDLSSGTLGKNQGANFDSNNFGKDDGSQIMQNNSQVKTSNWREKISWACKKIKESCAAQYQEGWKDQVWASGAAFAYLFAEGVDRLVSDKD